MSALSGPARRRTVFAVGRGQYENIGDVILRRPLLGWAREAGTLHVYTGASPSGYDEGLDLRPEDVRYRSLSRWYRAALAAALRGDGAYVFKPGEIQLTLVGMKEHLVVLPLLAALRARDGRAVRVGVGSRGFSALPRAMMRPSIALSDLTAWRDETTARYLSGRSMPDLALAEGASDWDLERAGRSATGRDVMVVSLRGDGDRPYPSPAALAGLRAYASAAGLEVVAVTQVAVDDARGAQLATDLGGRHLAWPVPTGHDVQEVALRELYRRTAVVVSDRLHVVIAAFTEGAVPVAGLVAPSDKIDRHLRTIGVKDTHLDLSAGKAEEVLARLDRLEARRAEFFARLLEARAALRGVKAEVFDVLTGPRPERRHAAAADLPCVHHLGRAGEVAGGMTQVVNGYLEWDFDAVEVSVLESRGAPGDLRTGVTSAARAALHILRLPKGRTVVVAHLSGGGSFVREGGLLLLAKARGLGTVAHLHGSSFAAFARRRPRLVGRVLRAADRVVTLSEEMDVTAARSVEPQRIVRVPNALPPGGAAAKKQSMVFGGAVTRRKGVDVLLAAWQEVRAPGWELVIAGPLVEPGLRREVPGVRWAGALSHADLIGELEASQVAVLPSRDEAMPMFILEAMARRNAVVSTDVGGIAHVLRDGRGIVLEAGDAEALRAALQQLADDEGHRAEMADRGMEAFEAEFSAARVFPKIEGVWLDALASARG